MITLWQDIKYGLRMLMKSPGFTVVAVTSLALAIGANTAIFSLINSMLFKSLPVPDPHELFCVNWTGHDVMMNVIVSGRTENLPTGQTHSDAFSYEMYQQFRDHVSQSVDIQADEIEVMALSLLRCLSIVANRSARTGDGLMVSDNFFSGLRLQPLMGRTLTPDEEQGQTGPAVVLSYRGWRRHFNGDPDVLGQTVTINGFNHTVIGVLSRDFLGVLGHSQTDLYVTIATQRQLKPDMPLVESTGIWDTQIMARIGPGVNVQQVQAGLDVIFQGMVQKHLADSQAQPPHILLEDGRRGLAASRTQHMKPLYFLMAIVSMVLVIACINLAGLLLARGAVRQHELAVRSAMGANRWHLLRQSLTDSMLIVLAGAGLGGFLATWGKTLLARLLLPPNLPLDIAGDMRVFAFTLGVSGLSVVLFSLFPSLQAMRVDPMGSLRDRSSLGAPRLHLGRVLVTAQMALCLLLLVGAGLFTRTLINLRRIETGFNVENLLTFQVNAGQADYQGPRLAEFYEHLRKDIQTLPGVQCVAYSNIQLLNRFRNETMMIVPGLSGQHQILRLNVSDSFLLTMGIPLLAGRSFGEEDHLDTAKVILVNQTCAQTVFPNEDPIGRSVIINREDYRIIGIYGDTKYYDLKVPVEPTVLFAGRQHPGSQHPRGSQAVYYQVRTALKPLSMVPAIRRIVADLDPMVPKCRTNLAGIYILHWN